MNWELVANVGTVALLLAGLLFLVWTFVDLLMIGVHALREEWNNRGRVLGNNRRGRRRSDRVLHTGQGGQ